MTSSTWLWRSGVMYSSISLLLALMLTSNTYAQDLTTPVEAEVTEHLLGDGGGTYKVLSDAGIDLSLIFKGDWNKTMVGGVDHQSTRLANLDFKLGFDGDKILGWPGSSAFIYLLANHGGHPSEHAGDEQGHNNIETPEKIAKVYEFWLQQTLLDGKVSVLLGVHDLNSEFYSTETSGLFINSGFGVGTELAATGANGPSIFPTPAPAVRLKVEPVANVYLQAAAFDTQNSDPRAPGKSDMRLSANDGVLLIAELAYHMPTSSFGAGQKFGIGGWRYSQRIAPTSTSAAAEESRNSQGSCAANSQGFYMLAEQPLTSHTAAFGRYGAAFGNASPVSSSASAGVVATGLLPRRDKDRLGLAFTRARTSPTPAKDRADFRTKMSEFERAHELSYRIELLPGLALQPDLQYVVHAREPMAPADAWIIDVRLEVAF